MYKRFYALEREPFAITPDPIFRYMSGQYKEALATMLYGVKNKRGLTVLTGEVGTGKTLMIRTLLESLDSETRTAYVFNPRLSLADFFGVVASEFGLKGNLKTKGGFLDQLNTFLLEVAKKRGRALLIVDEAQALSLPLLEEIRMLMNLETAKEKLLQVILAGQPEFHNVISQERTRQFKQRISLRCHLSPLNRHETSEYMQRRLQVAGRRGNSLFTQRAIRAIHEYSGGIPRLINVVCDNALLTGYAMGKQQIDLPIVREVIYDLDGEKVFIKSKEKRPETAMPTRSPVKHRNVFRWALIGILSLTVVLALMFIFHEYFRANSLW